MKLIKKVAQYFEQHNARRLHRQQQKQHVAKQSQSNQQAVQKPVINAKVKEAVNKISPDIKKIVNDKNFRSVDQNKLPYSPNIRSEVYRAKQRDKGKDRER